MTSDLPMVGVLDYGSGNLHSVCRALEAAGAQVALTADRAKLRRVQALVVPGVGAFSACMASLTAVGGDETIKKFLADNLPVLGICVGHQIMFSSGVEHGVTCAGLNVLPGTVEQLPAIRLPHMGWNTLIGGDKVPVLAGLRDQRFYFVHSYGVLVNSVTLPKDSAVAVTRHEDARLIAVLNWRSLTTTQFHPEKSGTAGNKFLTNWIATFD